MPSPDFTELTFGIAFLREFENKYIRGGRFPEALEFISQRKEATDGYDVKITLRNAAPVYIQLKKSFVLVRRNANEIKYGPYSDTDVYRMYLYKNKKYRQHKALQKLEKKGNLVFYVTSQIKSNNELSDAYHAENIVSDASAIFSPEEIVLPDFTKQHHVSFSKTDNFGYVYSTEPDPFERRFTTIENWLLSIQERRYSVEKNIYLLTKTRDYLVKNFLHPNQDSDYALQNPLYDLIEGKPIEQQVSILAFFLLNAQLTFVRQSCLMKPD